MTVPKNLRWEKILFRKQNFPDNYTDEQTFLADLRKNVSAVHYTLFEAINGASVVMSHIDIIVLYICLFESIQLHYLNIAQLLQITIFVAIICFVLYLVENGVYFTRWQFREYFRTIITLICFGYGFTPVIRTLTTSISTDSIYAMTLFLFGISLIFHDYGMNAAIVSFAFSVNLCLAASICLISRVSSDPTAFYLLSISLCLFCFWPILRNQLTNLCKFSPIFLLGVLAPCSIMALQVISVHVMFFHLLLHLFIAIICPILLIRMQKFKSTIHGPWDEATLTATIHSLR